MENDDKVQQIRRLIRINADAESGFETAARSVGNSELETLFVGYAKQHAKFARELEAELGRSGGSTGSDSSTFGGALHRRWVDLKAALSGHSSRAVLSACEGEAQSAEAGYADAGKFGFTGVLGSLIAKHEQQIKEAHKHLCRLLGEIKDGVEFQANEP